MESALFERDRVGVQDFVLLDRYQDEDAFLDNLNKRFSVDLIYTYIGQVLVSVNPYKHLDVYSNDFAALYRNKNLYELPPHVFAITDMSYRLMAEEARDQCVLISGESGAGKTEASKKMLQFLAAANVRSPTVELVKDKLLQSNPVLEAFGNAKTQRNDNSSRFGKYMDIEFDGLGSPLGGHINVYLLEKSRVVGQSRGERNFHIFYQLVAGADDRLREQLKLSRDPNAYHYLNVAEENESVVLRQPNHEAIDDFGQFKIVKDALRVFDFDDQWKQSLFQVVAGVLHLGNVDFGKTNDGWAIINQQSLVTVTQLLGCQEDQLKKSLTSRSIKAGSFEAVSTPLTLDQATYARDALAKAVYERLFSWLVTKLNGSLKSRSMAGRPTLFGLLDIYGFEIFDWNHFEQFCINYCNEKLQQLFIELTLKMEQEEYEREEIAWEPVTFFDNRTICDLIEERHKGIIAVLDEECLRPGDATDSTFLQKMEASVRHRHLVTHRTADNKMQKILQRNQFLVRHYAGDVIYTIDGFLDRNQDSLYRDLKQAMAGSSNAIVKQLFTPAELKDLKIPTTAGSQFKTSLGKLMDNLRAKEPWYVRCIKPNGEKRANYFDTELVRHQVKYLGLMENLRVRRAGFAYRRHYEVFLARYKSLSPRTWPNYAGPAKEGVGMLMTGLGYGTDDFRMGRTKIFIRLPQTLFQIEDAFQHRKHQLAALIQAKVKGHQQRRRYLIMRQAAIIINKYVRRFLAVREARRRRKAVGQLRRFVIGFMTRNQPEDDCNRAFARKVKIRWLERLASQLPRNILITWWPTPPTVCQEASELLRTLHRRWLVRCYVRKITPERKHLMEEKVLAEELFAGKKAAYEASLPRFFESDRTSNQFEGPLWEHFLGKRPNEKLVYRLEVTKYDRNGYKPRQRLLVITSANVYVLAKNMKPKNSLAFKQIAGLATSCLNDGLLIIRVQQDIENYAKEKGDVILDCGRHAIEAVTKLIGASGNKSMLLVTTSGSVTHDFGGRQGKIQFMVGDSQETTIQKLDGNLQVISVQ